MGCASFGVSQILVGLYRVGVVGLREAIQRAVVSGLGEREAVVDFMLAALREDNYIPDSLLSPYRTALWREYLRFRGEEISPFLSEVEVTVAGLAGQERDHLVRMLAEALAKHELKPVIRFEEKPGSRVEIGDQVLVDGAVTREKLNLAIRQTLSDW